MTGVTLQYTDDDRVFFEDVAGIGDAKVESAALLSSPVLSLVKLSPGGIYDELVMNHVYRWPSIISCVDC